LAARQDFSSLEADFRLGDLFLQGFWHFYLIDAARFEINEWTLFWLLYVSAYLAIEV
jgi:hypothetical protein